MRVLAIDPGYERLGVAVVEKINNKETLVYSDCLVTSKKDPFSKRLLTLGEAVEKLVLKYEPKVVAIEKLFFTTNQKTASHVSEVRGMLLYLAAQHQLETLEYTPLEVKSTLTGFGRANKEQIINMVRLRLDLPKVKKHDDEYDAIAIGLTTLARMKSHH